MSLIADALRTAQQERERQQGVAHPSHVVAEGFFAVDRRHRRRRDRRRMLIAALGITVLALGGMTFRILQPRSPGIAASAATPPSPGQSVATDAGELAMDATRDDAPVDSAEVMADPRAATEPVPDEAAVESARPAAVVPSAPAAGASPPPVTDRAAAPAEPPAARTAAADDTPLGRPPPAEPAAPGTGVELRVGGGLSGDFTELFAAALAAQQRGDAVRARDLYEQLVLARPQWAQAHSNLGTTYRSLGDDVRAEASFRRALGLDPEFAAAWSNLGMLLHAAGRDGEAMAALQHALELEPYAAGTRVNLATVMHASGLLNEARALLEEALGSTPLMPEAHYAMGRVLEEMGRSADAARHFDLFLVHGAGRFPHLESRVREHLARSRQGGA